MDCTTTVGVKMAQYETAPDMLHEVKIEGRIKQMDKGQDEFYIGEGTDIATGLPCRYLMITDGHGGHNVIRALRSISPEKMSELICSIDPVKAMVSHLDTLLPPENQRESGATMCLAKIVDGMHIECINVGDSRVVVFKDGVIVHQSTDHAWDHPSEKERLKIYNPLIQFTQSASIQVMNEGLINSKPSEYVTWPDSQRLACTQALGHARRTGYAPERFCIPLEAGANYRVFIASDGVWDMMIHGSLADISRLISSTADEIMAFVLGRWTQEWDMAPHTNPDKVMRCSYKQYECDDISFVFADITAKKE